MTNLIHSPNVSLPQLAYKGIPVVTTEALAYAYEVKPINIQQNFSNNKEHFVEGKHFFALSGKNLKEFKNCLENFESVGIGKRTPNLTLWTERGAARHAKMLNTDRAWDVFELLEETFFRVVRTETAQPALPDAPITPDQQCTLQTMVKALVGRGGYYANIWSRFNNYHSYLPY